MEEGDISPEFLSASPLGTKAGQWPDKNLQYTPFRIPLVCIVKRFHFRQHKSHLGSRKGEFLNLQFRIRLDPGMLVRFGSVLSHDEIGI